MRHKRIRHAIRAFQKKRQSAHEPEHGALVVAVQLADDDEERAHDETERVEQRLLRPDGPAKRVIRGVGDEAAEGPAHDVQEPEHGGPVPGFLGRQRRVELRAVVVAEDGVDGELGAEGAEVAGCDYEGLRAGEDGKAFLEGGLADDFAFCGVKHLLVS